MSDPQAEKLTLVGIAAAVTGFHSLGCAQHRINVFNARFRHQLNSSQHLTTEATKRSWESKFSRVRVCAAKYSHAYFDTQIYPIQQRASKADDRRSGSQAKSDPGKQFKKIRPPRYRMLASSTVQPKATSARGSSGGMQPAFVGCIRHLKVFARSLFIIIKIFPFAAALISTTASSQTRPTAPSLQCSQVSGLVASQGAVVISTGQFTYERIVVDANFCVRGEVLEPFWTKTADVGQCFIGYRCGTRTAQLSNR